MAQTVIRTQPINLTGLWRDGNFKEERDFAYSGGFSEGEGALKNEVH